MASTADIPLLCSICPGAPKFSDLSHLLTHIGSKAHLAHDYKAKVLATTDEAMKATVEAYDAWYKGNDLDRLMAERISQKDKKRARATRSTGMSRFFCASGELLSH
jgi:hypothetical protein